MNELGQLIRGIACVLVFALLALSFSDARADVSTKQARKAITRMPGFELTNGAVRVRPFLTGRREAIVDLSVNGFKLAAGGPTQPGNEPLLHSAKLAVADKEGMIREYYGALNDDAPEHVAATITDLLKE